MKPAIDRRRTLLERLLTRSDPELRLFARLAVVLTASLFLFAALALVMPAAAGLVAGVPAWGITELLARGRLLGFGVVLPLACTFLCLLGFGVHEIMKVAGPDFRVRDVAQRLQELCIPRGLRTRRGDYLQRTTRELNLGLERLHDEIAALQQLARASEGADAQRCVLALQQIRLRLEGFTLVSHAPECDTDAAAGRPGAAAPAPAPEEAATGG